MKILTWTVKIKIMHPLCRWYNKYQKKLRGVGRKNCFGLHTQSSSMESLRGSSLLKLHLEKTLLANNLNVSVIIDFFITSRFSWCVVPHNHLSHISVLKVIQSKGKSLEGTLNASVQNSTYALLAIITTWAVQLFAQILIHKAIFFMNALTVLGTTKVIG